MYEISSRAEHTVLLLAAIELPQIIDTGNVVEVAYERQRGWAWWQSSRGRPGAIPDNEAEEENCESKERRHGETCQGELTIVTAAMKQRAGQWWQYYRSSIWSRPEENIKLNLT